MTHAERNRAYWVRAAGEGELRDEASPDLPATGWSIVRAEISGVSVGTERLVGTGRVPISCDESMACRSMRGDFRLPIKYGYTLVGIGAAGTLEGQRVFVMHPHQSLAAIEDKHATPIPDAVPPQRAALTPNLETALNAVWDAELQSPESAAVVGGGAVGLLIAFTIHATTGQRCDLFDTDPQRREFAASLPWVGTVHAELDRRGAYEVAFHTSGNPDGGLQCALDAVGFEGRVIELSWYGERRVHLELGTAFHSDRKRIFASQVSAVAPTHRQSHGYDGRLHEVMTLLADPALDALVEPPIPFEHMPELMHSIYDGSYAGRPVPLISYPS